MEKRYYLIDYENVKRTGLKGIDKLTEKDEVVVFYGYIYERDVFVYTNQLKRIYNVLIRRVQLISVGKNHLDFQIGVYAGWLIGKNNKNKIYLISGDNDFNVIVKQMKKCDSCSFIKKYNTIKDSFGE